MKIEPYISFDNAFKSIKPEVNQVLNLKPNYELYNGEIRIKY